jgi:hypothetical protein
MFPLLAAQPIGTDVYLVFTLRPTWSGVKEKSKTASGLRVFNLSLDNNYHIIIY